MLTWFIQKRQKKLEKKYQLNQIKYLPVNFIPAIIVFIIALYLIMLVKNYSHHVGDFLFYFVGLLKLQMVLKLNFLSDKKFYDLISKLVYYYIALSIVWDAGKIIYSLSLQEIFVANGRLYSYRFTLVGFTLNSFDLSSSHITMQSGFLRRLAGLERIIIKQGKETVFASPFLFRLYKHGWEEINQS